MSQLPASREWLHTALPLPRQPEGMLTTEPFKNDKYVNYVDMREDINRVYYGLDFFQP